MLWRTWHEFDDALVHKLDAWAEDEVGRAGGGGGVREAGMGCVHEVEVDVF